MSHIEEAKLIKMEGDKREGVGIWFQKRREYQVLYHESRPLSYELQKA